MEGGDVADVDDAEAEVGTAGQGAVEEALHDLDGGGEVGAQDGAEDADGVCKALLAKRTCCGK